MRSAAPSAGARQGLAYRYRQVLQAAHDVVEAAYGDAGGEAFDPLCQRAEDRVRFEARERLAGAAVKAVAEGKVIDRIARDVEARRVGELALVVIA